MKRNKFSLSHYKLFSCDMGELIPCGVMEVLPGDTIQQNTSLLLRCSPLLAPVMHPIDVRIHHWYVPHRLVWDNWEAFITGGPDGMNNSVFPTKTNVNITEGSLPDYLGVPPQASITFNALPVRGYATIWNEWYRDQDLEAPLVVSKADGNDTTTNGALQNVAWEKDYYTSARPWEQKGPQITLPLGTTAPIIMNTAVNNPGIIRNVDRTINPAQRNLEQNPTDGNLIGRAGSFTGSGGTASSAMYDPNNTLLANLAAATAVSVNTLRQALALQRFEEARARYGSRYVEYLRYLGVKSSDARLQLPEYLGGGRQTIQFSEVLQTAPSTAPAGSVGDLKGHGIASVRSNRYRRFFEEHGYVFTLASVRPKTIYMNGLFRHWNRRTKNDYWQKEFEHIGQQAILNKEVYSAHTTPDGTFGYQDRYDEYRRTESSVSGEFRSTLNFWHLARIFSSDPALNSTFIRSVPTERVFAVQTNDVLWCMARHSIQARRLVAQTGTSMTF